MPPSDCGCHLLKRSGSVLASRSYSSLLFPKKRKAKRKIPKACYFTYYPTPENKRQEEKSQTSFGVASVWPRCHSLTRLSSPQSLGGPRLQMFPQLSVVSCSKQVVPYFESDFVNYPGNIHRDFRRCFGTPGRQRLSDRNDTSSNTHSSNEFRGSGGSLVSQHVRLRLPSLAVHISVTDSEMLVYLFRDQYLHISAII